VLRTASFLIHSDTGITNGAGTNVAINGSLGGTPQSSVTVTPPWQNLPGSDPTVTQCQTDKHAAYTAIMSLTCTRTIAAALDNTVVLPGVNCATTMSMAASTTLTFDAGGNANAEFYMVCSGAFGLGATVVFILTNGALARNIFFGANSAVTIGATNTYISGTFLASGVITLGANVFLSQGRLLGLTSVGLGATFTGYLPAGVNCLCQWRIERGRRDEVARVCVRERTIRSAGHPCTSSRLCAQRSDT
jgi:hypothetical protein